MVLCCILDRISKKNRLTPAVLTFSLWYDRFSILGLDKSYRIVSPDLEGQSKNDEILDPRAIALTCNVFDRMLAILKYAI